VTQHIITVKDSGHGHPAWMRSVIYDDADGEIYLPIVMVRNKSGLMFAATHDKIKMTVLDGNIFYPMSWLKKHQGDDKKFMDLCDIITKVVKRECADARQKSGS